MKKHRHLIRPPALSRREFLRQNAALIGGTLLAGPAWAASEACRLTDNDILGPFYRTGAPFRSQLAGPDEPGDRLIVSGTVTSADCRTPLPGTLIEVWQANAKGLYDTYKPGNFTETTSFHLRGMLYTDDQGRFEIETVMPGSYPIPPGLPGLEEWGGRMRPAHIHFKVQESLHVPVTGQMYFKGDPHIANDPYASRRPGSVIELASDGDLQRGRFDIALARGF
jgi:catechol 1,2-dioxygenase